jgi:hypothetical protein
MSLLHSAQLNGHDPYAYLKDVLGADTDQTCQSYPSAAAASLAIT